MSDSQPQQASSGQQLLRPDDILKLQSLPDDEKQKYRLIMQNFWTMVNQNPQGSQENTTARQKLSEWSQKFIGRERAYRIKMKAQLQQGGQGPSNQANPAAQQNPNPVKQEVPQALNRGVEGVAGPVGQQGQGQQAPPNQSQGQGQGQGQGRGPVDPAIIKHVHEFPMHAAAPPQGPPPGTPEYDAKIKEYRTGYLNMLAKQASIAESKRKCALAIQERRSTGQPIPQEMEVSNARLEREHSTLKDSINKFRGLQKSWKDEREKLLSQGQSSSQPPQGQIPTHSPQQQQHQPPQPPQQAMRQPSQPNLSAQTPIKEEQPHIKIESGQAPQPQPHSQFNVQGNQQQAPPQQQHAQIPSSLPQQQQQPRPLPAQSMPPNQIPQYPQQPGQQQQQQQQQQTQQQQHNFQQHQQQQQQRPQINPMQANAHPQSNSPHPQSATPNAPGLPVSLSHQAAVSAANRSYTDPQRTNTPMQQQQGGQGTFGSREREQLNNPKMPIPRALNITAPQAVHMGQARPTMSGPTNGAMGPMGQPVIPRPPPFQLEGEGNRVLSKRKLDELVRQVTGGSEEALTPEVEEVRSQSPKDIQDLSTDHFSRLFSKSPTTS
ncbi:hypothetical protein EJ02DRAFT_169142 [Clathrospora elynae]|uniref:Uncharacterized protein n=1 Tax=Clathrospora elynae TaxID=706981 RepID=A0A6A5SRP7_9PLEO|nr:hypothetical protein EJ02DRAFT_169142 [Clathrospora elynae]